MRDDVVFHPVEDEGWTFHVFDLFDVLQSLRNDIFRPSAKYLILDYASDGCVRAYED